MTFVDFIPDNVFRITFWYAWIKAGVTLVVLNIFIGFLVYWNEKAGNDVSFFKKCPLEPNPFYPRDGYDIFLLFLFYFLLGGVLPFTMIAFLKP